MGRTVAIAARPERIVSLVPSLTETLIEWGLRDRLVGITSYCVLPKEEVRGLERVGGTKDPDVARILELAPDLVIANAEENRKEDVAVLERHLACWVTYPRRVSDVKDTLTRLGAVLGCTDEAEDVARGIEAGLTVPREPQGRVIYLIWRDPWMSINRDTYIHDVLACLGMDNVFGDHAERYFEITLDRLKSEEVDWLLLPSEPYPFQARHARELASELDFPMERIKLLCGEDYCWFGNRTARVLAGE